MPYFKNKHPVTNMLLSSCVSQKVFFSATVSEKKKAHFSQGQMLKAGTCSLNHPLGYSTWVSLCTWKSLGLDTQETGKCMKMSFSFDCPACLLTWSLASRDCLGRLYSITDFQYLLSKRGTTCKMSSPCDVSSKMRNVFKNERRRNWVMLLRSDFHPQ